MKWYGLESFWSANEDWLDYTVTHISSSKEDFAEHCFFEQKKKIVPKKICPLKIRAKVFIFMLTFLYCFVCIFLLKLMLVTFFWINSFLQHSFNEIMVYAYVVGCAFDPQMMIEWLYEVQRTYFFNRRICYGICYFCHYTKFIGA